MIENCQFLTFKVNFPRLKLSESFSIFFSLKNINFGAHFLFSLILCSIKIEWVLFLKYLKNLAFFDSYFWPFNKTHEKIIAIFMISAIMASIWNVFIKFRWHDEKLTQVSGRSSSSIHPPLLPQQHWLSMTLTMLVLAPVVLVVVALIVLEWSMPQ